MYLLALKNDYFTVGNAGKVLGTDKTYCGINFSCKTLQFIVGLVLHPNAPRICSRQHFVFTALRNHMNQSLFTCESSASR